MGTNGQLKAGILAAFAMIGVSIVVLTGWAGQISLGQMAFVGAGAAVGAWGMADHGWDPLVAMLVGGLMGAVTAVLVGLPALRVRGLYLAVVTLAIGIAASEWVFSNRAADWIPESIVRAPTAAGAHRPGHSVAPVLVLPRSARLGTGGPAWAAPQPNGAGARRVA